MASIDVLEELDDHNLIVHAKMKSIMYQACRDVVMYRHWRVLEDGTIVHAEFSVDHPRAPEGANGFVRAELTMGGAVIRAVEGDPLSSIVFRINDMDPKLGDAIPAWATNKLNEFTSSMIANNMFELAKLVKTKPVAASAAKGPLVNHDGKVTGGGGAAAAVAAQAEANGGGSHDGEPGSPLERLLPAALVDKLKMLQELGLGQFSCRLCRRHAGDACPAPDVCVKRVFLHCVFFSFVFLSLARVRWTHSSIMVRAY